MVGVGPGALLPLLPDVSLGDLARPPVGNRFCRPGQPSWLGKGDRKHALLGDLCLAEAPLELYSAAAREQAQAARRRRSEACRQAEAHTNQYSIS